MTIGLDVSCPVPGCGWMGQISDMGNHAATHSSQEAVDGIAATMDFETWPLDELERWIADHGQFDDNGDPTNEASEAAERALDAHLATTAETTTTDPTEADTSTEGQQTPPWQVRIAAQLAEMTGKSQYRWIVLDDFEELVDRFGTLEQATAAALSSGLGVHRIADVNLVAANWNATNTIPGPEPEPVTLEDDLDIGTIDQPDDDSPGTAEISKREEEMAEDLALVKTKTLDDVTGKGPEQLFDANDYTREDLAIPKVDGQGIDRIALDFGGSIILDRSDPLNVELYNRVHGSRELELWVTGRWGGTGARPATNRDGELDVIVGRKSIRIDSVRIIDPAVLGHVEGLELVRAAAARAARAGVPHDQIEQTVVDHLATL